ncbi:MAG: GatB/YqeY domain-containing protein [Rhodospirillales bacterium]|nr:GatB/YqeY domain-containing protein [Rhodospirillales bacterium]
MRGRLEEALRTATLARDQRATSTLRLILAALRDRDIAERSKGNLAGLSDEQIVSLLHSMVRQRHDSIKLYEEGGREDLARQEAEEIAVIEQFMPPQMSEAEVNEAVTAVIAETEAKTLKDMGRVMAVLRERYAGRMDLARAGSRVKGELT